MGGPYSRFAIQYGVVGDAKRLPPAPRLVPTGGSSGSVVTRNGASRLS